MNAESRTTLPPMGLVAILATVTMFFTAFTASYLARRTASDWSVVPMPAILWGNTILLGLTSVALELGRRVHRGWLKGAFLLAGLFLLGQIEAWRQVRAGGFSLAGQTHTAYVFILMTVHAIHLLGGLTALLLCLRRPALLETTAVYWHFIGLVWIWILALLWMV